MTKTLKNRTFIYLIIAISVFLSVMTLGNIHSQLIFAQANSTTSTTNTTSTNTTSGSNPSNSSGVIDSFRANGLISSLASDTIAGTPNANKTEMQVLGGTWEANVLKGKLTNFVADIEMTQINGKRAHHHTIEKVDNSSGMPFEINSTIKADTMAGSKSTPITLQGNSTMFRGTADITTNGKVQWKAVPVHVAILNGNILNLSIELTKTNNHFKGLPVFGTVVGIIDQNGKTIVTKP